MWAAVGPRALVQTRHQRPADHRSLTALEAHLVPALPQRLLLLGEVDILVAARTHARHGDSAVTDTHRQSADPPDSDSYGKGPAGREVQRYTFCCCGPYRMLPAGPRREVHTARRYTRPDSDVIRV